MMKRLMEELRPRQILDKVRKSSVVFVPVSPLIEWHSFHLPMGVDGLLAEAIAESLAETFDGLYCRCIPIGLDAFRTEKEKQMWGLNPQDEVYGMNFPGLPLTTEAHTPELLDGMVAARLTALKQSGFRFAFLVNQHGGAGQNDLLNRITANFCDGNFKAEVLAVPKFNTFHEEGERRLHLKVGGHAGLCETLQLMAFRPELIDLDELSDGSLPVAETGILHHDPLIPAEFNPRRSLPELAARWKASTMENMAAHIRRIVS